MKIEVGESLIASYLNHVEQCRIVQTNWRVSGNWEFGNHDVLWSKQRFDTIKNNELLSNIFKDNTFEQLVKQSEIDVLGINTLESTIYAYDIAFHSMGLNYKGNEGSCEIVVKKIVRAIFSLKIYFPEFEKIESFFVTPKANNKIDNLVKLYLTELNNILNDSNIKIGFLCNDDFFSSLVDSLIDITKNENDSSELFLRSIKLMSLDKRATTSTKTKHISSTAQAIARTGQKRMVNGMKIGQYVKNSMYELFVKQRLSYSELLNLQDLEYCRVKFKIGFPVLLKNTESKKDSKGNNRYYKDEVIKGYWLCSQWVENQWDNYLAWEASL